MTTASTNPKVEKILLSVHNSYGELVRLVEGPLTALDAGKLYVSPAENEWTIMQNLSHVVEFMPYWANEIAKLVASPGQNFGRTMQHEGRMQAVNEHGRANLTQIKEALPESYARLERVLGNLKDSDLELTGHHIKFGEKSLEWFIAEFVTGHLSDHVGQIKACYSSGN